MIHGKHPEKGQTPRAACMENKTSMKEDTQDTLEKLRRVGFSTFVRYYPQFIAPHCEIADIKVLLKDECGYTQKSCNSRASKGKCIVRNGNGKAALEIISRASKIKDETRKRALELLGQA